MSITASEDTTPILMTGVIETSQAEDAILINGLTVGSQRLFGSVSMICCHGQQFPDSRLPATADCCLCRRLGIRCRPYRRQPQRWLYLRPFALRQRFCQWLH